MSNNLPDFQKIARELLKDAQTIVEVEMINFIMSNFEKQGFTDKSFTPWIGRKNNSDSGRAILTKSGGLRDSITITESSREKVVATASAKHSSLHNEGGILNIPVTPKMRKWFWYMFKRTKEAKYKSMALTRKQHFTIIIPKRQFMGDSEVFVKTLESKLFLAIADRFKQNLNTN